MPPNEPRSSRPDANLHGVLIIDKPVGPTSHDVVARMRKTLGTRAIGHAGTLDPAASGVLVVAIGEATKLVPYLTRQTKRYEATIAFGTSTNTLDREGEVTRAATVPIDLVRELARVPETIGPLLGRALASERDRREQVPPAFSALKQGGRSVHERARRGEHVELAPRAVEVLSLDVLGATSNSLDLALGVSKGYYVRCLAKDLGDALGVPSHLSALRRTASGPFTLERALPYDATRDTLVAALEAVASAAARALPVCRVSAIGRDRAQKGQVLSREHFDSLAEGPLSAWLDEAGELVAIGRADEEGRFVVQRGFGHSTSSDVI